MILVDIVSEVNVVVSVGIHLGDGFIGNDGNVDTVPSTWADWDSEWTVTESITVVNTIEGSVFIFTFDETLVEFTGIDNTISIEVTFIHDHGIMFSIDFIFWGNVVVVVGIIEDQGIFSDSGEVITIPSSVTFLDVEWTFTIGPTVIWTFKSSIFVFNFDDTFVDFTSVNGIVSVKVTVLVEEVNMIVLHVIT